MFPSERKQKKKNAEGFLSSLISILTLCPSSSHGDLVKELPHALAEEQALGYLKVSAPVFIGDKSVPSHLILVQLSTVTEI